jgi:hypothetical protein
MMEIKMSGDVVLVSKSAYPAVYVTQRRELELQATNQANSALRVLLSDTRLVYESKGNKLIYRSMLVSKSLTPNAPCTAVGVQIDSASPIPKLRFEYRFPKLVGSVPLFDYSAINVNIIVELTPKPDAGSKIAQPAARAPQPAGHWQRSWGSGSLW